MHRYTPVHRWLYGAAAGALATLLLAPASSWLVRNQLGLTLLGRTTEFSTSTGLDKAKPADHMPNDLQVQLAAAFERYTDSLERTARLRLLKERFGDQPALYATILRSAAQGEMTGIHREELYLLDGKEPRRFTPHPQRAEHLAAFEADAARGEDLDPDNAYFPLLRSAALFASHRDDEALAAISRAASKSKWDEYVHEEALGKLRLSEAAYGRAPAIVKTALFAAILFPQYAVMRSSARIAVYKAMESEKAGDFERGIRIRSDLVRIGDRLRADGRSLITSLVGRAVTSLSLVRPGGGPVEKRRGESADELSKRNREAYSAFLRAHDHPEEAEYLQSVLAAGDGIKEKIQPAIDESAFGGKPMWRLLGFWAANLTLLGSVIWMVLLGSFAAILCRTARIREGRPLTAESRWALWGGTILSGLVVQLLADGSTNGAFEFAGVFIWSAIAFLLAREVGVIRVLPGAIAVGFVWFSGWVSVHILISTGMLALAFLLLRSGTGRANAADFVRVTVVSMLAVAGLGTLLLWQTRGIREIGRIFGTMLEGGDFRAASEVTGLLFVFIPLLFAALIALVSRFNRVPVTVGVCRAFRGLSLPLACLLALAYCGTLLGTLRMEKFVDDGLNLTLQHEGRYIFGIFGAEWPALVPPPERAERKDSAE